MIKIENTIVTGWEAAIRGARNPMNSHARSDSGFKDGYYVIGENDLDLPLEADAVPMVYPFLALIKGLREKLIENKIFVARYWPNVLDWTTKDDIEYLLACQMQPLPIDQRYGEEEMKKIIEIINK